MYCKSRGNCQTTVKATWKNKKGCVGWYTIVTERSAHLHYMPDEMYVSVWYIHTDTPPRGVSKSEQKLG